MAMKKTTATKVTTPKTTAKKTVTTNVPRKGNPTVTSKAVTVSPKREVRQTYHQNEVYVIKGTNGKPTKVSYEKFQMAPAGQKQRMSAKDWERLRQGK